MIGYFLLFFVFLVAGAAIYQFLAQSSGYFLIVWGNTSIEMSLWFALLCLVVIIAVGWVFLGLLSGSLRGVITTQKKIFSYRENKAQAETVDGLIDYIEEDWPSARRKLTRSATRVRAPVINYLAAARSAYEIGDKQEALELLYKAETCTNKSGLAVAITQARMQLGNQQYEEALASLERAEEIKPEHRVILNLRKQVYVALRDWSALKALLPKLAKNNVGTAEANHRLEVMLYREKMLESIEKLQTETESEKLSGLEKIWSGIPNQLQREQSFLFTYAGQLMALDAQDKAEKVLASALNRHWHEQWVDLYGLLLCSDTKKPLQTAEKWLEKHASSAHLLLALGRLCMLNQQWGRARDYFQKSLQLQKRPETYAELARLLEHMGETDNSLSLYKQGVLVSTQTRASALG